jgi:hypothetical protein
MGDGDLYCHCGHAIVSHNPAGETFACCVRGCDCAQFTRRKPEPIEYDTNDASDLDAPEF